MSLAEPASGLRWVRPTIRFGRDGDEHWEHGAHPAPDGREGRVRHLSVGQHAGADPDQRADAAAVRPVAHAGPAAGADLRGPRPAAPGRARRQRRAQHGGLDSQGRQLPALGLPPARLDRGGVPPHPARHPDAGQPVPAPRPGQADHREAGPDPDGRRHRHRQEHHARVDAGAPQPDDDRSHPHHRGSDRIPVHQQALAGQPARGRPRHRLAEHRAEERAAPGAGLHPDR